MRVGAVAGGFVLFAASIYVLSLGVAGYGSCATSGALQLPFLPAFDIGCPGFDALLFLGVGGLFVAILVITWGTVASDEPTAPEPFEAYQRRRTGPPVHSFGIAPRDARPPEPAEADLLLPRLPPRAPQGRAASPLTPWTPPFEERPCPSCGFSNLLDSSVCAHCGKPLARSS
jgi:hypothetical protein